VNHTLIVGVDERVSQLARQRDSAIGIERARLQTCAQGSTLKVL